MEHVEVITAQRAEQPESIEDLTGAGHLPTVVPAPQAPIDPMAPTGSVLRLRQYVSTAQHLMKASLAMQVMAGFELSELKRLSPYRQGRKPVAGKKPQRAGFSNGSPDFPVVTKDAGPNFENAATWEEWLHAEIGISADTAGRWMAMADAARTRLRRLDGFGDLVRDLMERPITALSGPELELLESAVKKLTDGRTQMDFLAELGLAKKPGNPSLGGATQGGGPKSGVGLVDDAKIKAAAVEDWGLAERYLVGGAASFTVLDDSLIEAQLDVLVRAAQIRREWLAANSKDRTPALVAQLAKTLTR